MKDVTFQDASLKRAVLGGERKGVGCKYFDVRFDASDMTGCVPAAAEFTRCSFLKSKLRKLQFRNARLSGCFFAGDLVGVVFWNHDLQPNLIEHCDFGNSRFRGVSFNYFDFKVDDNVWPTGPDHYVVTKYRHVLERAIVLSAGTDVETRVVRTGLSYDLGHAGPITKCRMREPNRLHVDKGMSRRPWRSRSYNGRCYR